MAIKLKDYEECILRADDYDMLSYELNISIRDKMFNSLIPVIMSTMKKLNYNTPSWNFVKTLLSVVGDKDMGENALNLLKEHCNPISRDISQYLPDLDAKYLYAIFICADDKTFMKVVDREKLDQMIDFIGGIIGIEFPTEESNPEMYGAYTALFIHMMYKFMDGMTPDQFKYAYKNLYARFTEDNMLMVVNPMTSTLMNILQGNYAQEYLIRLDDMLSENEMMKDFENAASNYLKYKDSFIEDIKEKELLNQLTYLMRGFTLIYREFRNKFEYDSTRYLADNFKNSPVVGDMIRDILSEINFAYDWVKSPKMMYFCMRDAFTILQKYIVFPINTRWMIDKVLDAYSIKYEETFYEGDCFQAVKASLDRDPAFKESIIDIRQDDIYRKPYDEIYRSYMQTIVNPFFDYSPQLGNADTADSFLEVATEAIGPKKKNNKLDKEVPQDDEMEDSQDEEDQNQDNEDEEDSDDNNQKDQDYDIEASQSNKGYKKGSKTMSNASKKIYGAYKKYKDNESKVDSQLTKMLNAAKRAFTQDKTEEIIEGKKFTPIGLLKRILVTGAIFSYSKVAGFVYLLVRHTLSKKRTTKQKQEILIQLDTEIKLLDEKIEDARADGNRNAKYALMRTRAELERAKNKIKYGLSATKSDMRTARDVVD